MENEIKREVIYTEDYKGSKIEILLVQGVDFKQHKIIINGNCHTTDKTSSEEAIDEAKSLIEDNLKKKKQKKKKI